MVSRQSGSGYTAKKNAIADEIVERENELCLLLGIGFEQHSPQGWAPINDKKFLEQIELVTEDDERKRLALWLIHTWKQRFVATRLPTHETRAHYAGRPIISDEDFEIIAEAIELRPTLEEFRRRIFTSAYGCKEKISDEQRASLIPKLISCAQRINVFSRAPIDDPIYDN